MATLPRLDNYDDIYRQFRWQVPARYNIGVDICDRWAAVEPDRLAILHVHSDGRADAISYGAMRETSNRLANVLRAQGIGRGDRVAIMLPQMPEVAAAHIAIYKLGAIALPIAILFGPDALSYRLQNSGAKALLTNAQGLAKLDGIRDAGARTHMRAVGGRRGRRRRQFCRLAGAGVGGLRRRRYRRRRSGHDDLHLRHHRPAERRAARPPGFDRSPARHRAAAFRIPASRRPLLDARRLGVGRRPARRAAAEPASRRAGGGAQVRQVRSGRSASR